MFMVRRYPATFLSGTVILDDRVFIIMHPQKKGKEKERRLLVRKGPAPDKRLRQNRQTISNIPSC